MAKPYPWNLVMNTMVSVAGAGLDRAWTTVPFAVASSMDMTLMPESIWGERTLLSHQRVESQREAEAVA